MILINKNTKPNNTIYYISACTYKEIKEYGRIDCIEVLYNKVTKKYNLDTNYDNFIYGLNFLYILNKIEYEGDELIYVD